MLFENILRHDWMPWATFAAVAAGVAATVACIANLLKGAESAYNLRDKLRNPTRADVKSVSRQHSSSVLRHIERPSSVMPTVAAASAGIVIGDIIAHSPHPEPFHHDHLPSEAHADHFPDGSSASDHFDVVSDANPIAEHGDTIAEHSDTIADTFTDLFGD